LESRRYFARAPAPKGRQRVRTRKIRERIHITGRRDSLETVSFERSGEWLHEILQGGAYTCHEKDAVNLMRRHP
jgi:hypothetical protein